MKSVETVITSYSIHYTKLYDTFIAALDQQLESYPGSREQVLNLVAGIVDKNTTMTIDFNNVLCGK